MKNKENHVNNDIIMTAEKWFFSLVFTWYSQGRSSTPSKTLLMNWLFEKWIHKSFPWL